MKLTVLQENFSKALNAASRFTTQRAQLPVLGNIRLTAKKTILNVSATNLEMSISISVGAQSSKEGDIAVPAKVITEIVSNLQSGAITLESEKEQLKISSGNFSSVISGMNTSDFPSIPQGVLRKDSMVLPGKDLLQGLSQVLFSTSIDETRPILTGVLMLFAKGGLTLVGTDGFRLSQKKIPLQGTVKSESMILPKNALTELLRIGSDNGEILLNFKKEENQVVFAVEDLVLSSRILEGTFPDYEKIIPKSSSIKVNIDKEDLLRAVKLASVFARESANIIKLTTAKQSVSLSAESQSSGNQKMKLDAKVDGGPIEIAFNYRFLEEYLHSVKGDDIEIEFSNPNAPGVFTDPSDKEYLHLIMPVKIQS